MSDQPQDIPFIFGARNAELSSPDIQQVIINMISSIIEIITMNCFIDILGHTQSPREKKKFSSLAPEGSSLSPTQP